MALRQNYEAILTFIGSVGCRASGTPLVVKERRPSARVTRAAAQSVRRDWAGNASEGGGDSNHATGPRRWITITSGFSLHPRDSALTRCSLSLSLSQWK